MNFDRDPRVVAVRADDVVGLGTCTYVDECFTDEELVTYLNRAEIKTPKDAINEMRTFNELKESQERDVQP